MIHTRQSRGAFSRFPTLKCFEKSHIFRILTFFHQIHCLYCSKFYYFLKLCRNSAIFGGCAPKFTYCC